MYKSRWTSGLAKLDGSYADDCFPIDKATMEITPKLSAQMDRDLVHTESETEGENKI